MGLLMVGPSTLSSSFQKCKSTIDFFGRFVAEDTVLTKEFPWMVPADSTEDSFTSNNLFLKFF
jgi:hypothetical protein